MDTTNAQLLSNSIRAALLKLARQEDARGATLAGATPYWAPCPPAVLGHYAAAAALREYAEALAQSG